MEKETVLGSGEYAPPQLELLEIAVEKGFAVSDWGNGGLDDNENELGESGDYY